MKMDFVFSNMFWGILIILIGLSIFLKGLNIQLPLVKVFIAIVIIMFGVKLLIGGKASIKVNKHHYRHDSSVYYSGQSKEYTMVFASGTIDLSDLPIEAEEFEVTVVFGSALVVLPDDLNYRISPTSVFGSTALPPHKHNPAEKSIEIESTAVFGRLEYEFRPRKNAPEKKTAPADSIVTDGF
jgi:predicted membrane protein